LGAAFALGATAVVIEQIAVVYEMLLSDHSKVSVRRLQLLATYMYNWSHCSACMLLSMPIAACCETMRDVGK
jgi:hypothetical protein